MPWISPHHLSDNPIGMLFDARHIQAIFQHKLILSALPVGGGVVTHSISCHKKLGHKGNREKPTTTCEVVQYLPVTQLVLTGFGNVINVVF